MTDVIDPEDGELRPMCIEWKDRVVLNKIYYIIYRIMRFLFVVIYYYFFPLLVLEFSLIIPTNYGNKEQYDWRGELSNLL